MHLCVLIPSIPSYTPPHTHTRSFSQPHPVKADGQPPTAGFLLPERCSVKGARQFRSLINLSVSAVFSVTSALEQGFFPRTIISNCGLLCDHSRQKTASDMKQSPHLSRKKNKTSSFFWSVINHIPKKELIALGKTPVFYSQILN